MCACVYERERERERERVYTCYVYACAHSSLSLQLAFNLVCSTAHHCTILLVQFCRDNEDSDSDSGSVGFSVSSCRIRWIPVAISRPDLGKRTQQTLYSSPALLSLLVAASVPELQLHSFLAAKCVFTAAYTDFSARSDKVNLAAINVALVFAATKRVANLQLQTRLAVSKPRDSLFGSCKYLSLQQQ